MHDWLFDNGHDDSDHVYNTPRAWLAKRSLPESAHMALGRSGCRLHTIFRQYSMVHGAGNLFPAKRTATYKRRKYKICSSLLISGSHLFRNPVMPDTDGNMRGAISRPFYRFNPLHLNAMTLIRFRLMIIVRMISRPSSGLHLHPTLSTSCRCHLRRYRDNTGLSLQHNPASISFLKPYKLRSHCAWYRKLVSHFNDR